MNQIAHNGDTFLVRNQNGRKKKAKENYLQVRVRLNGTNLVCKRETG